MNPVTGNQSYTEQMVGGLELKSRGASGDLNPKTLKTRKSEALEIQNSETGPS
jgi:hypothetical protein